LRLFNIAFDALLLFAVLPLERAISVPQRTPCATLRRRTNMADTTATLYSSDQNLAGCHLLRRRTITHHNLLSEGATAMIGVPQLCFTQILGVFLRLAPHS
jgi:hypothetical protein|tara:strand:- start:3056 stop:3358 length:303 start_codon:yes stop_codon:yes gene_type:complete